MATFKTDNKDEIPVGGKRLYGFVDNNGAYIYRDLQIVRTNGDTQDGDTFGADELNKMGMFLNGVSNCSLAINDSFQVWQNGTEFEPPYSLKYTADQWFSYMDVTNGLYVRKSDYGIVIKKKAGQFAGLCQPIEINRIEGYLDEIFTLSVKIDGNILTAQFPLKKVKQLKVFGSVTIAMKYGYDNNENRFIYVYVYVSDTSEHLIEWVKPTLGGFSTPHMHRPYAEELALCKRYYDRIKVGSLVGRGDDSVRSIAYHDVRYMRVKPTVKVYDDIGTADKCSFAKINGDGQHGQPVSIHYVNELRVYAYYGSSYIGAVCEIELDARIY